MSQSSLEYLRKLKKHLSRILEYCLIIAVAILLLDVIWGVFSRYALGEQSKWTEELACFLLIWISLLGGALAFGTKGHLGVDFFVNKLHPSARKLMAIVSHLSVLIFASLIFLYGGSKLVVETLDLGQTTAALNWQMGYVYLALPISGFFMVLYTLENLYEEITTSALQLHEAESAGDLD